MGLDNKRAKSLLSDMLLARCVDKKMQKMVRQNKGKEESIERGIVEVVRTIFSHFSTLFATFEKERFSIRCRRELSFECLLANLCFDTAEN